MLGHKNLTVSIIVKMQPVSDDPAEDRARKSFHRPRQLALNYTASQLQFHENRLYNPRVAGHTDFVSPRCFFLCQVSRREARETWS